MPEMTTKTVDGGSRGVLGRFGDGAISFLVSGIGVVTVFAMGLATIVGSLLGIKYMLGSVATKVQVKKGLIIYVTACLIVFGGIGFWAFIILFATEIVTIFGS